MFDPRPTMLGVCCALGFALLSPKCEAQAPVSETITDTGLRIWTFPDDGGDRFLLMVLVGSGARQEDPANSGVAHLLEHVLLGSTKQWTKAESHEHLDRAGGTDNGYTSHDVTTFYLKCSSTSWRFAIEWMAAHLVDPAFNEADIVDELEIVYEEIDLRQPHAGSTSYGELFYPGHALGRSIGGDLQGIRSLDGDDLREFYARHYRADNMAIGFAGKVPREECMAEIASAFAGLASGTGLSPVDPVAARCGTTIVPSSGNSGAWMHTGYHLPTGGAEDLAALLLIADYLDNRCFAAVREDRQLSYAPSFYLDLHADTTRLSFDVNVSSSLNLPEVAEIIEGLLEELANPLETELRSAKRSTAKTLWVNDLEDLGVAMELSWWVRRAGQSPMDLQQALHDNGSGEVAAYAATHLLPERRFTLANAQLSGGSPLVLLFGRLFIIVLIDGVRGFVWWNDLRRRWNSHRENARTRRHAKANRRMGVIIPISGHELEKDIQQYFEDEDRVQQDEQGEGHDAH